MLFSRSLSVDRVVSERSYPKKMRRKNAEKSVKKWQASKTPRPKENRPRSVSIMEKGGIKSISTISSRAQMILLIVISLSILIAVLLRLLLLLRGPTLPQLQLFLPLQLHSLGLPRRLRGGHVLFISSVVVVVASRSTRERRVSSQRLRKGSPTSLSAALLALGAREQPADGVAPLQQALVQHVDFQIRVVEAGAGVLVGLHGAPDVLEAGVEVGPEGAGAAGAEGLRWWCSEGEVASLLHVVFVGHCSGAFDGARLGVLVLVAAADVVEEEILAVVLAFPLAGGWQEQTVLGGRELFALVDVAFPGCQAEMLDLDVAGPFVLGAKDGVAAVMGEDAGVWTDVLFTNVFAEFCLRVVGLVAGGALVVRHRSGSDLVGGVPIKRPLCVLWSVDSLLM